MLRIRWESRVDARQESGTSPVNAAVPRHPQACRLLAVRGPQRPPACASPTPRLPTERPSLAAPRDRDPRACPPALGPPPSWGVCECMWGQGWGPRSALQNYNSQQAAGRRGARGVAPMRITLLQHGYGAVPGAEAAG